MRSGRSKSHFAVITMMNNGTALGLQQGYKGTELGGKN